MEDKNLKLKLKSELKNKMPKRIFIELLDDMGIDQELGKNEAVDFIFEKYSNDQVKDLILKEYDKNNLSRNKEKFLNTINRVSIDERPKLNKKDERENKRKLRQKRIQRNKEKQKKREEERKRQIEEENKRKEEERKRNIERLERENKRKEEERKRQIEEENKRKEEERKKQSTTEDKIEKTKTAPKQAEEKPKLIQNDDDPIDKEEYIENIIKKYKLKNPTNYHKRNLYETSEEDIEKAFQRKFDYPAVPELNINHALYSNIYFLYDYIKNDDREYYKNRNVELSEYVKECFKIDEKLIKYKYHNKYIPCFTKALFKGVKNIYQTYFTDKDGVALISVPSSTKDEDPQTKKSIVAIKKGKEDGEYEYDFEILDYSDLLIRCKSVKSSSKGGGRSLDKHFKSIIFNEDKELSDLKLGYILLDDITTSGNIMYACRSILIDNGFENEDIISLTIGRTVDNDELIYTKDGLIIEVEPYRVERWNDE